MFVLSCLIAVSLDPLFFYVPVINDAKKCLDLDQTMEIIASVLRSFMDMIYILHIILQFRTGFIVSSPRGLGRGVLVEDTWLIAKKYLLSNFFIDILAILPLPQVVILIRRLRGSHALNTKNLLKFVVVFQYVPRVIRTYPLLKKVTRISGLLTETAWAGAAFNLFLFLLASHVLGALWYLFSIEREITCWKQACKGQTRCFLYCENYARNITLLNASCPIQPANLLVFDFGVFLPALQSGIVESIYFPKKFFYCFWWGLRNLSSIGQNLQTSTFILEICFAVFISISGLVLFSFLIGNMQTYLQSMQSTTKRLEESEGRRRDVEQWMAHHLLPEELRERVRRYEQYKWKITRGVDEENLLGNLSKDLRRDIKRHLCLALLRRVPIFEKLDKTMLDAMCDYLKPAFYTKESYIVREGDRIDEMLFVMRGKLFSMTTNGGRTGFFNSTYLVAGDFCGEEILTWALDPKSSSTLPVSTRAVRGLTEVEAFALKAEDLKSIFTSQFWLIHGKQLRHTFRFYSLEWRTWAACYIQAVWRRYSKKKLKESLLAAENRLRDVLAEASGSSLSLGATIYASRFATNAFRAIQCNGTCKAPTLTQKPAEPNFIVEEQ